MRLAAASISIVQIQELVNIRGTGDMARIYGVEDNTQHAKVGKQSIFEATYRHSVQSFAENNRALRGVWAPADFSDMKFFDPNPHTGAQGQKASIILPVLQGFISGINETTRLIAYVDVIIEYVPNPTIKAMVTTSVAKAQVGE